MPETIVNQIEMYVQFRKIHSLFKRLNIYRKIYEIYLTKLAKVKKKILKTHSDLNRVPLIFRFF